MAERHLLNNGVGGYDYLERDASDVDGMYRVMHQQRDDEVEANNAKIRSSKLIQKGDRAKLGEGGVMLSAFSIRQDKYFGMADKYPDLWAGIHSDDVDEMIRSWEKIKILHPQWLITV